MKASGVCLPRVSFGESPRTPYDLRRFGFQHSMFIIHIATPTCYAHRQ